jgi:O-antigen/teichoic acid export membrane protein
VARASAFSLLATQCLYGAGTAALSTWLFRRTVDSLYTGEASAAGAAGGEDLFAVSRFLRFSLPLLFTSLAVQVAASAERWGLASRATPEATALFVQAIGLSLAATTAATMPVAAYFATIISQAAASSPDDPLAAAKRPLKQYIAASALILFLTTIGVSLLSRPLTTIFFGARYHGIFELLPWAMVGQALFGLAQVLAFVPITVEATAGVAAAFVASKVVYVAFLFGLPYSSECTLQFSKCFALGNLIYLAGIGLVAAKAVRRRPTPS